MIRLSLQRAITSTIATEDQLDAINYAADLDETEGFILGNQDDVDAIYREKVPENETQATECILIHDGEVY